MVFNFYWFTKKKQDGNQLKIPVGRAGIQKDRKGKTMKTNETDDSYDAPMVALLIGVFMTIISFLSVVTCIGVFIYIFISTLSEYKNREIHPPEDFSPSFVSIEFERIMLINGLLALILIISILEFAFSIVLTYGASKKKTGHLIVYFVYGNVKSALMILSAITLGIFQSDFSILIVAICGVNTLISGMVYMALENVKKAKRLRVCQQNAQNNTQVKKKRGRRRRNQFKYASLA